MTKTLRFKNAPLWDGGYARGMKIGSCTIVHIFEDGHALGIDPNDYPELDVESLVVLFHPQEIPTLKLDLSPECMWVGRPYLYRGGIMPRVPVVIVAVTPPNVLYWSCGNVYEMQQSDFLRKYKPVPLSESEPEPPVKVGDVIRVENKEKRHPMGAGVQSGNPE